MSETALRAVVYASSSVPRPPALTFTLLRTMAERRGWVVVGEFWDLALAGCRFDPPDGWGGARTMALRGRADVLVVARVEDVACTLGEVEVLAAWAADHQVPILCADPEWRGRPYRLGPDPNRLSELRHPPLAVGAVCPGLPVRPAAS
ncbi:recombinase family protein [Kitasatospora sp. NPDC088783]|uniref:recombinase family protein n=1 Tax=Kitasatospora sp. NPDC088783 TaxID=3364077 RepID=UPI0038134B40